MLPLLRAMSSSPNWASLPPELLLLIYHHLPFLPDHLRFRAVCRSWHSATASAPLPLQPPLLLLPSLASLLPPPYTTPLPLPRPLPPELRLLPTSHSLLLALSLHPAPSLLNPLTSALLPLPPLTTLPLPFLSFHRHHYTILPDGSASPLLRTPAFVRDSLVRKAVFSGTLLALAVHHAPSRLFVARPGDASWSPAVPGPLRGAPLLDFTWWRDRLYAADPEGRVAECSCSLLGEAPGAAVPAIGAGASLLEGGGELFQVRTSSAREEEGWRRRFEVWRLAAAEGGGEGRWERAESLGEGRTLFWCGWNWMMVECGGGWRRGNCVCYVSGGEEYRKRGFDGYDLAVYDLRYGSTERITFPWNGEFAEHLAAWFLPALN